MTDLTPRVGIVGAGVAGLSCAEVLRQAGVPVTLFDKGRAPGGRLSTRRGEFTFDHGVQYFTADDETFRSAVAEWVDLGVVAEWTGRIVAVDTSGVVAATSPRRRLVGVPGMRALAAHLAVPLDVRSSTTVALVEYEEGTWILHDDHDEWLGSYEALVLTAPAVQTAALLTPHPLAGVVATVTMAPCLALMAAWHDDLGLPFDGAFVNVGPLSWIARDGSKPGRPAPHTWVAHAGPAWSTAHLHTPPDDLVAPLMDAFAEVVGQPLPPPLHAAAHRWHYAQPVTPLDERCLADEATRLAVAGDWCGRPKVEGAWLSGRAAARRILEML
jgi:renalase